MAVFVALLFGGVIPIVDHAVDGSLPGWLSSVIFNGDAGAAQTVLDAISSSLITVTSLTFSLTVVTLQLASSQFSPRLLRTFSGDIFVQVTLALFLATFIFSLTVMRLIRSSDSSVDPFVPRLAVTLAFLLAVASVFVLVLFLAHLTQTIRVEAMLDQVRQEAEATIQSVLDGGGGPVAAVSAVSATPAVPAHATVVLAARSGFITAITRDALLSAAVDGDAVISIDVQPGSFVVRDVPLARVWSASGASLSPQNGRRLGDAVHRAVLTGFERTAAQDVAFGLRQLTDVANKALSPGVNDPTTAVHALGHVAALLCDLADRPLGVRQLRDADETVRVVVAEPDFDDLVEMALTQPRRYGASDPQVQAQILRLLAGLAYRVPPHRRPVVTAHLLRLERTISDQDFDETERALLAGLGDDVRRDLRRPAGGRTGDTYPSDRAGP